MSDFEMVEQEQNHKGFDDSNIENDFNPKKKSGVSEKPYFLELSIEEKSLIEVLSKLNIEKESQIAIGLLFRKYNISISEFLNILKNYNPKELNTEKIIEIVLDMRK